MKRAYKLVPAILFASSVGAQAATFTVSLPAFEGDVPSFDATFPLPEVKKPPVSFASLVPQGEVIKSISAAGAFGSPLNATSAGATVLINGVVVAQCEGGCGSHTTPWSYTFTQAELAAFSANEAELSYIQNFFYVVSLDETVLTITTGPAIAPAITATPVPALGIFGLMGLAGAIGAAGVAMNRRRKL